MSSESASAPSSVPPSPLRHHAFRAIWLAAVFSSIGNWLRAVGEAPGRPSLARQPILVALVATSQTTAAFLLVFPSGVLSDRFDRSRLLLGAQSSLAIVAAILATFTWLGFASPALILLASAALGIGSALSL